MPNIGSINNLRHHLSMIHLGVILREMRTTRERTITFTSKTQEPYSSSPLLWTCSHLGGQSFETNAEGARDSASNLDHILIRRWGISPKTPLAHKSHLIRTRFQTSDILSHHSLSRIVACLMMHWYKMSHSGSPGGYSSFLLIDPLWYRSTNTSCQNSLHTVNSDAAAVSGWEHLA